MKPAWLKIVRRQAIRLGTLVRNRRARARARREGTAFGTELPYLRALLESPEDAVFVKDLRGRYVLVNDAATKDLGGSQEEVLGRTDFELLPAADAERLAAGDREILSSGKTRTFEEVLELRGPRRIFLSTKGPVRDPHGRVIGLFGVAHEITQREAARREELARERSRRIEAEATVQRLSQAFSSHALGIERGIDRMARLIDDLRSANLGEALAGNFSVQPWPVSALLAEVSRSVQTLCAERGLCFEVEAPEGEAEVLCDRSHILPVFSALVGRVMNSAPRGGVVVLVAAPEGDEMRFSVRETGTEKAPAARERAGRISDRIIAQTIVEALGGRVKMEDELGRGGAFSFTLPISR
jgi:PAS domain S-box-containing protein